jgi:hypothetical protein
MAWQERIPQLSVKSDSKILINMVLDNCMFSGLVQRICNLLILDYRVKFHHTIKVRAIYMLIE